MAQSYVHPRTLGTTTGGMPGSMMLTFLIALVGMALLFVTLWKYEMASKSAGAQVRALRLRLLGDDDALPRRSAAPSL
jgi:heme exporter protein C